MQSLRQFRHIHQSVSQQLDQIPQRIPQDASSLKSSPSQPVTSDDDEKQNDAPDPGAHQARQLAGIEVREREAHEGAKGLVFIVRFNGSDDPHNPHNWPRSRRLVATAMTALLAMAVTATSSIEAAVQPQAAQVFHVSDTAAALTTGMYLIGFSFGSLIAGSFSETFGRNAIYLGSLVIYMAFILGSALAPNFGAIIIFRFLSGFFGSTPLTVAGGTVADVYTPLETTWGFPLFAIPAFAGPLAGPVIAAWIPYGLSVHWAEWLMLILSGLIFVLVTLFQPETYAPLLLKWKASSLRKLTGDERYRAESEIRATPLLERLGQNMIRPFLFVYTELIVLVFALYLTILYIVLFTFLPGYTYIFERVYGISQGLTNTIFVGLLVGNFAVTLLVPFVYRLTRREYNTANKEGRSMRPEIRLWYAMLGGAISIPVSLFWVGWTCYPHISIWSPIVATTLFGFGLTSIFITAYMYIIDVYQMYAASALSFNAFLRYLVAGGMTVAGIPMYEAMGPHWVCTFLGILGLIMVPVPYVLYKWGHVVRQKSKNVVNRV